MAQSLPNIGAEAKVIHGSLITGEQVFRHAPPSVGLKEGDRGAGRKLIVVIVVAAKPSGLRVDDDFAGLSVLGPHRFEISSLAHDLHV